MSLSADSAEPCAKSLSVSVVVPCRNEIRHIRGFLDEVFLQECEGLHLEILVSDGVSEDGTREVLREYERAREGKSPLFRVIENLGMRASTGLNAAIRASSGEIIIRMDVHTDYARDYIRNCLKILNETNADNVGGPALTRADGYLQHAIALGFHLPFASGGARFRDPEFEGYVDTVPYGCWKKSTLDRIGLFDESLDRNQDGELNLRLISSGGKIWQSPKIVSWYRPRSSLRALFLQYFQYGRWKMCVTRRHGKLVAWRNLIPGASMFLGVLLSVGIACASWNGSKWWATGFLKTEMALGFLYFTLSLSAAVWAARREGWRFLPILPIVFATYHLSYGLGFLLAIANWPQITGSQQHESY